MFQELSHNFQDRLKILAFHYKYKSKMYTVQKDIFLASDKKSVTNTICTKFQIHHDALEPKIDV